MPEFELVVPPGSYQAFIFNRDVITVSPGIVFVCQSLLRNEFVLPLLR